MIRVADNDILLLNRNVSSLDLYTYFADKSRYEGVSAAEATRRLDAFTTVYGEITEGVQDEADDAVARYNELAKLAEQDEEQRQRADIEATEKEERDATR